MNSCWIAQWEGPNSCHDPTKTAGLRFRADRNAALLLTVNCKLISIDDSLSNENSFYHSVVFICVCGALYHWYVFVECFSRMRGGAIMLWHTQHKQQNKVNDTGKGAMFASFLLSLFSFFKKCHTPNTSWARRLTKVVTPRWRTHLTIYPHRVQACRSMPTRAIFVYDFLRICLLIFSNRIFFVWPPPVNPCLAVPLRASPRKRADPTSHKPGVLTESPYCFAKTTTKQNGNQPIFLLVIYLSIIAVSSRRPRSTLHIHRFIYIHH